MQLSAGELHIFCQSKNKYTHLPSTGLLATGPNLLHLSCSLLYELVVLSEQNINLRESEGRAEGRAAVERYKM